MQSLATKIVPKPYFTHLHGDRDLSVRLHVLAVDFVTVYCVQGGILKVLKIEEEPASARMTLRGDASVLLSPCSQTNQKDNLPLPATS